MPRMLGSGLSRREREALDILYRLGKASAADVQAALPDMPSYSAVRTLLHILEDKGHIGHEEEGKRYIYFPSQAHPVAARSALRNVVQTFFGGSLESAVQMFLSDKDASLSEEELTRMAQLIENARQQEQSAPEETE